MATKPSNVPGWTVPGVEPAGSVKTTTGHANPPAKDTFDWFWTSVSAWVLYLQELVTTSNKWTATQEYTRAAQTDAAPTIEFQDPDGGVRQFVDSLGGISGACISRSYWFSGVDIAASTVGAVVVPGGNGGVELQGDTGTDCEITFLPHDQALGDWRSNVVQLKGGQTVNQGCMISSKLSLTALNGFLLNESSAFSMEWSASRSFSGGFTSQPGLEHNTYMGLHSVAAVNTNPNQSTSAYINFRQRDADTNWQAVVCDGNGAETVVDTGVAPVLDQSEIFRIEYHGADTPRGLANGTAGVVVFFIDGAIVATISDGSVPAGSEGNLGLYWKTDSRDLTPTVDIYVEIGLAGFNFHPLAASGYTLNNA